MPRDDEAEQFWIEVGVPKERIFGMGAKDNFWQMGDTGPCGPCSEIFYDFGLEAARGSRRGQAVSARTSSGTSRSGTWCSCSSTAADAMATLTPLPKPSIDTGMGLERIACVLQGVLSNYRDGFVYAADCEGSRADGKTDSRALAKIAVS